MIRFHPLSLPCLASPCLALPSLGHRDPSHPRSDYLCLRLKREMKAKLFSDALTRRCVSLSLSVPRAGSRLSFFTLCRSPLRILSLDVYLSLAPTPTHPPFSFLPCVSPPRATLLIFPPLSLKLKSIVAPRARGPRQEHRHPHQPPRPSNPENCFEIVPRIDTLSLDRRVISPTFSLHTQRSALRPFFPVCCFFSPLRALALLLFFLTASLSLWNFVKIRLAATVSGGFNPAVAAVRITRNIIAYTRSKRGQTASIPEPRNGPGITEG